MFGFQAENFKTASKKALRQEHTGDEMNVGSFGSRRVPDEKRDVSGIGSCQMTVCDHPLDNNNLCAVL